MELLQKFESKMQSASTRWQIRIDGWSAQKLSNETWGQIREWGMNNKIKYKDQKLVKKIKSMQRYSKVGFLDKKGNLLWKDWWEFGHECSDVIRLMAKGAQFRVKTKRLVVETMKEEVDKNFWQDFGKYTGTDAEVLINMSKNTFPKLVDFKRQLYRWGILMRKEDKGNRMIFVDAEWEDAQLEDLLEKQRNLEICMEPETIPIVEEVHGKRFPQLYFLPKTHKGSKIPGRPIVSWCKESQKYHKRVKSFIKIWMDSIDHMDKDTVSEAVDTIRPRLGSSDIGITGDIKSMYTNVPRVEIFQWIEEMTLEVQERWKQKQWIQPEYWKEFQESVWRTARELKSIMELHLSNTFFTYGKEIMVRQIEGVDMGSKISPIVSRGYMCWKERQWMREMERNRVEGSRYVDDVSFIIRKDLGEGCVKEKGAQKLGENCGCPKCVDDRTMEIDPSTGERKSCLCTACKDVENVKKGYERIISPMEIDWIDHGSIMDTSFHEMMVDIGQGEHLKYVFSLYDCRGKKNLLDNSIELPQSVIENTLKEHIRRVMNRSGINTVEEWYNMTVKGAFPLYDSSLIDLERDRCYEWEYNPRVEQQTKGKSHTRRIEWFLGTAMKKNTPHHSKYANLLKRMIRKDQRKIEEANKEEEHRQILRLTWGMALESTIGRKYMKTFLNNWKEKEGNPVTIWWKYNNLRLYNTLLHKDKFFMSNQKATEESLYDASDETGST